MKIISNQYYLIIEDYKLVVYDIKSKKVDSIVQLPKELIFKLMALNDIEMQLSTDSLNQKLMEKLGAMIPYIICDIDEETFNKYLEIEEFLDDYINLHKEHYTLKEHMLKINLRHSIYFKKYYIYSNKREIELPMYMHVQNCTKFVEDIEGCHIIDRRLFSKEEIVAFESYAITHNIERIYFGEQSQSIVIGPALIGNDYGCVFCNELPETFVETSYQAKQLISSMLQYELLHYDRNMLSFSTIDNTLCKGKYFEIRKADFSGHDKYITRKFNCLICGGAHDKKV